VIAEVLNREFVLDAMRQALADPDDPDDRREAPPAIQAEVSEDELAAARKSLAGALEREQKETSGQTRTQPEGDERRGAGGASLDDAVFIARDKEISLFQSVLDDYFESQHENAIQTVDSDDRRGGEGEVPPVTDRSLGLIDDDRRLARSFEPTDILWVNCLFAMAVRKAEGKRKFNENSAPTVKLEDSVRLVVVGDWGTGVPRAQRVAEQMNAVLDQGQRAGLDQHVIHLGDVYYSGWPDEYEKRCLKYWPVEPGDSHAIGSWSLNGNHDMYSGGDGYFDTLLADSRFERQQRSSWFKLENGDWKILGLDTAYDDHDLRDPQADWVAREVDGSKRVLLLSHHQLFSTDPDKGGPKLEKKLKPVLDSGRVTSWFWGHEHRCVVYEQGHGGVGLPSCVGHGGVPIYATHSEGDRPKSPATYEYYARMGGSIEFWTLMGFAVIDLNGGTAAIRYIDENGKEHHKEAIA
jgi:calcineurin-like phosphoesterase family protein